LTLRHLTDNELTNQLTLRDDLTALEHELLARLIRAMTAVESMEDDEVAGAAMDALGGL